MKKQILSIVSITILLLSCGDTKDVTESTESTEEQIEKVKEERIIKEVIEYYALVDKLRVRKVPGLESTREGAQFVDVLDEGEKVTFLGEKSEYTQPRIKPIIVNPRIQNNKIYKKKKPGIFLMEYILFSINLFYTLFLKKVT